MGKQSTIEINGKKYDAATGAAVDAASAVHVVKPTVGPQTGVGVVDGFARKSRAPRKPRAAAAPHAQKSTPQKSTTLARKAVQKPAINQKVAGISKPSISKSSLGVPHARRQAAKTSTKSPHIKKFDHAAPSRTSVVKKNVTVLPKKAPAKRTAATAPPLTTADAKRVATSRQASARMIEQALSNANSHEQEAPAYATNRSKKRTSKLRKKLGVSSRAVSLASASLAVVLLAGFFAVQNVPNLSMRVAATRAGFDATMPGYNPSGFSFKGPINYNAGQVTVNFASNSDDREYSVTQRSSNWTSEALLANFIDKEQKQYQTFLDKGRTLYLYDGSNATWVDDGIWYQIEGESDLTTDQLVRIASSI